MVYNRMVGEKQNNNILVCFEYTFYFSSHICTIIYELQIRLRLKMNSQLCTKNMFLTYFLFWLLAVSGMANILPIVSYNETTRNII